MDKRVTGKPPANQARFRDEDGASAPAIGHRAGCCASRHSRVKLLSALSHLECESVPVVQWIELLRPKEKMWVRFLPGALIKTHTHSECEFLFVEKGSDHTRDHTACGKDTECSNDTLAPLAVAGTKHGE